LRTFLCILVLIFLALLAYIRVLCVSSYESILGEMHAIITVLQFPPKESFRILVNFESLYGIKALPPFSPASHNALIQFPRANNDLLIFAPSISLIPLFSVFEALSLPARSIRDNFPTKTSALTPVSRFLCSIVIYRIA